MPESTFYAFLSLVLLHQEILLGPLIGQFLRSSDRHGWDLLLAPLDNLCEGIRVVYDIADNPKRALNVAVLPSELVLI